MTGAGELSRRMDRPLRRPAMHEGSITLWKVQPTGRVRSAPSVEVVRLAHLPRMLPALHHQLAYLTT